MSEKHDKGKIKKEKEISNEDDESLNKLNINEEYAERFQHNEKRKKEEKLRNKYGVNIKSNEEEENSGEESPEESEDSEGELDNEIVRDKFINTLLELKDENETKKLLENKAPIFTDDDFKQKREKIHKSEDKEKNKIQYGIKDALLDNKSSSEDENSENNIYSVNYKPKKIEEDQTEKKAFISAANEDLQENSENSEDNDFFDNGLLIKKKTGNNDLLNLEENLDEKNSNENEGDETSQQAEEKVAGMSLSDALKKSKIKPENVNMSLLELKIPPD